MPQRSVFVTVGTTKFDSLIQTITKPEVLQTFSKLGYKRITFQIGNGEFIPEPSNIIEINYFRLKPSIKDEIRAANLVISHAGAGSCLEILAEKKPLIVVINENLMGNHQVEIAGALARRGFLQYCVCGQFLKILCERNYEKVYDYPMGNPKRFADYLDKCVGFC